MQPQSCNICLEIEYNINRNYLSKSNHMFHRFLRFALLAAVLTTSTFMVFAQPCPDTEPFITGPDVVCANLTNTLSYTTPLVTGHNYSWSVTRTSTGAGGWSVVGSTTSAQLDIRWTAPGNYQISLTEGITSSSCTPKTVTLNVTVQPFLAAYFTYVATSECFNNIVDFQGDRSNPPNGDPTLTYEWTFSNVASGWSLTDNTPNPTISFPATPGVVYDATLKVKKTDAFGRIWEDAITDYVYVDPNKYKPIALYTATPVGCLYDGIRFDASASQPTHVITSESILHFTWDFGDGNIETYPGTQPIITHNYTTYGNYTVLLTVTNTKYCTETTTPYVLNVANTIPFSQFSISPACLNEATLFDPRNSITPVGTIIDLYWTFGDGSQATTHDVNQIVNHIYTDISVPLPATLRVRNSQGCLSDIYQLPVTVYLSPRAVFSHGNACTGNPVVFTNTSQKEGGSNIVLNEWDFGDGQFSTDVNPTHLYTGNGTFTVTLTVTNNDGCKNVANDVITVSPRPDVEFTLTLGNSPFVVNFQETLNPVQFVGNNLQWDFGDGSTGTGPSPVHNYPGPGTFLVTLVGTDMQTGCPNTVQHSITLGAAPTAYFTANPQEQCQGQPISFIPTVPPGGLILDEDWYFNDGSLPNPVHYVFPNTPAFPVHTFANPGTYLVERYVNRGTANEAYHSLFVTIDPLPGAQFTWFSDATLTHQEVGCDHQPVYFIDASYSNSTPSGVIYKWQWNFGDPASGPANNSSLQNPTHIFLGTGPFTVTLTVTDNLKDCQSTITRQVIINPPIPVEFTYTDNTCLNLLATFTPDPALIPSDYTWLWNFGDGQTSTNPGVVTHLFPSVGVYTVSLTLTDQFGCTKSITHNINIIPTPVADFTFTSPTCHGQPIQFTDLSYVPNPYPDIIIGWNWNFGDGVGTSILKNPVYTYPAFNPAGYNVTLIVTTNRGCSATRIYHVQPIPAPAADFEIMPLTPVCAGQAVQFHDISQTNGVNIASWNWDFGDPASGASNVSTAQNPTHTYNFGAGPYQVTLIVKNANNCSNTVIKTITINTPPTANFTATEACQGTNTAFTDISITPPGTTITSYTWDFGDGFGGIGPNPMHSYGNYGSYNVRLTIVNTDLCVNEVLKQVRVHPNPIADFIFSPSTCIGNPVSFTSQATMPPANGFSDRLDIWVWDFGDGSPPVTITWPANPNIIHTFLGPASSHIVTLTVTTNTGCTQSVQKTVNSVPSPTASFAYSGNLCEKQTVQFTDLTLANGGGSIQSWSWNFGDPLSGGSNTSNLQNPIHSFQGGAGTYTVTLVVTNTNSCTSTFIDNAVVINRKPLADFTATSPCENSPTVFTNNSVPYAPAIVASFWEFGDGFTSNQPSPSHTFLTYGIFNVKLTVTNSNGCVHDTTKQVSVYPKPAASFTFSSNACVGNAVNYVDHSTVPGTLSSYITTWTWDFGDGSPVQTINYPGNPNISYTFIGVGTVHTVRLTVTTTAGCTNFIDQVVTSIPAPIANFYYSTTNCLYQPVQFTDQTQTGGGGNIQFWNWNFGDPTSGANNFSTLKNPTHVFLTTGSKTVTLTVTSMNGCTNTTSQTITINSLPVSKFTATTACLSSVTTFTDQSTPPAGATIVGHFWEFGDGGTSTIANPVYTYLTSGNFLVKLTVTTDQGCVKDTTIQVSVYGKPTATFSFNSPTCSTDSVYFTDHSATPHGSINKWDWDFGDGSPVVTRTYPQSPNVAHKYANGGPYNVKLTITTSDNCIAEKTLPVQVEFAPLANFDFAANACAQVLVLFHDISQVNSGAPIIGWNWNFGDPGSGTNNTSGVQNPTHAFTTGGSFDVTLIVNNANGCKDTIQKPITVNNAPVAMFIADTACVLSSTQFTDQSTTNPGTIIAWLWSFGDPPSGPNNISTLQNPTHNYNAPGTYTVRLTVTNSATCTKDTTMQISVNPKPIALFQYGASCVSDSTQFTDLSIAPGSSVTSWLWDFGDASPTATQQNPKHAFATSGTFQVKLVVTNLSNCRDSVIIPVVVRPKPTAAYSYVNFFCPAGQVNFQDQSTGAGAAITEHLWIFEPGYTSTLVNPVHVFPVTNVKYWVQLIVTDNYGCKDTIGDSVFVKPGRSFTFSNDTVCLGYPTQFQAMNMAPGDSLYSVVWNFGDPASGPGNISYLYNPTHIFTQAGHYIVKMKAWNSNNCVDSVYRDIQVFAPPRPAYSFQTLPCDSTVYFHDSTNFTGSGPIASWEWIFGDGTPPLIIPAPGPGDTSHLYINPGIYPVTLIITNANGCMDSLTQNVQRFPCIRAVFSYQDTLRCARYHISFSDSSLPVSRINSWHWNWGDGNDTAYTVHGTPISHVYADSGTYAVTLAIQALVDGVTIKDSITTLVTIHPTPYSLFSNAGVCLNQPTIFLDNSNTFGEPITKWNWEFGEPASGVNDTSTRKNPTHTYMDKGLYDVQLLIMNKFGCEDSLTKTTRVYGLPVAHFNNSVACTGDPTYFTDNSVISDTITGFWAWNFGDLITVKDTSNLQDPVYRYKTEGDYSVRFIVKDFYGCADTVDSLVKVNITPTSAFTFADNFDGRQGKVKLNNLSAGATIYNWDFGNGSTSTEDNPIISYTEDGTYIIKLIALNQFNCSDTTFYEYKLLFKGLYVPNAFSPTNTILAVRLFQPVGMNLKQYHVTVFDGWGHLVWESMKLDDKGRPAEGWDGTYNGELMPQGNYMWKITALFVDDTPWNGSDIGQGEYSTMGTVSLIR